MNYTTGFSSADFCNDAKTIDAVIRNLEIIGEAARRLPEEIRIKFPDVEWHKIISLRNILIHEYPGIDLETIWDIIENKLSPLKKQVKEILQGQQ
ncbi:MAG: DUF86 domain-containing protein [Syntrophobacterales bacterium]|nr:DUF86 domain-containing protein [Syntrophobacterales bacterium]